MCQKTPQDVEIETAIGKEHPEIAKANATLKRICEDDSFWKKR
jgi:hypothetical protein